MSYLVEAYRAGHTPDGKLSSKHLEKALDNAGYNDMKGAIKHSTYAGQSSSGAHKYHVTWHERDEDGKHHEGHVFVTKKNGVHHAEF